MWDEFRCLGMVLGCLLAPLAAQEEDAPQDGKPGEREAVEEPGEREPEDAERETDAAGNELEEFVAQLGHDRFKVREEATAALMKRGVEVVPVLLEAAVSDDPEVRLRCRRILTECLISADAEAMFASEDVIRTTAKDEARGKVAVLAANLLEGLTARRMQVGRERLEALGATVSEEADRVTFGSNWKGTDREVGFLRLLPAVSSVTFKQADVGDGVPVHLKHLPALTYVNFNRVGLSDTGARELAELTQLTDLRLRGTKVTDAGLQCVKGMTGLETLSIEETAITDEGLQHLAGLRKLDRFYAGRSGVRGQGFKHLRDLPALTYLSLEGAEFQDEGVQFLQGLEHLQTLGLDGTKVGDACVPQLAAFKELEVLWLSGSEVTDEAVEALKQFTHLTKLHLKDTRISQEKVEELREALGDVEVTHSVRVEAPEEDRGEEAPDPPEPLRPE